MKDSEKKRFIEKRSKEQDNRCYYCGKKFYRGRSFFEGTPTIDHKTPAKRGGGDDETNLVIACFSCNSSKNNLTEEEYASWKEWRAEEDDIREQYWIEFLKSMEQINVAEKRLKKAKTLYEKAWKDHRGNGGVGSLGDRIKAWKARSPKAPRKIRNRKISGGGKKDSKKTRQKTL